MKRTQIPTISLLAIIMVAICFLHACEKNTCWTCKAYDNNGQEITEQKLCSDEEEQLFRLAYFNADKITCQH